MLLCAFQHLWFVSGFLQWNVWKPFLCCSVVRFRRKQKHLGCTGVTVWVLFVWWSAAEAVRRRNSDVIVSFEACSTEQVSKHSTAKHPNGDSCATVFLQRFVSIQPHAAVGLGNMCSLTDTNLLNRRRLCQLCHWCCGWDGRNNPP